MAGLGDRFSDEVASSLVNGSRTQQQSRLSELKLSDC
jgi:hypothetical protein